MDHSKIMSDDKLCNRRASRRVSERRSNPHPFNSEAWIAVVQQHYQMWPKQDRRKQDRRSADRRDGQNPRSRIPFKPQAVAEQLFSSRDLLNDDEKQLILQLFAEDIQN